MGSTAIAAFVERWSKSSGSERATKDQFLLELCDLLGVEKPRPATGDPGRDLYVFEKDVFTPHEGRASSIGKIDFYKHEHFLLEAKQGSDRGSKKLGTARRGTPGWNIAMRDAYGQALGYAQWLDAPPPFLITCDIGHCFDLYAAFDGTTAYRPFPNPAKHRLYLADLADHVDLLRTIFTEPQSLDPSLESAKVTREVAERLAALAKSLEASGHDGEDVARFLMRCIFTMFAEDIGLLPDHIFTKAVKDFWIKSPKAFPGAVESLWRAMNDGSWYVVGRLLRFNGGLFRSPKGLPLSKEQLELLRDAAECKWSEVEPAIFGTLLERALDKRERHKLGAHFTPPAYVQRLVRETIEEPLRAQWSGVQAEVRRHVEANRLAAAKAAVKDFHATLCTTRVLDPACGTGNFLYVALNLFKRLEGEVLTMLVDLEKGNQTALELGDDEVKPRQFLGIEVKPWAKEIADLVLWIGYLQWHFKAAKGMRVREPVLTDDRNVSTRDAVLRWERIEPARDDRGTPLFEWDGLGTMLSPVTGELVPDEASRRPKVRYVSPIAAEWPEAEYIIGNPPYLGARKIRGALTDGYVEALRAAYPDVPETADLVMYWWHKAALAVESGATKRFGFITTNSIIQDYSRPVLEKHLRAKDGVRLTFAIPDHPWIESKDGAAVRVAMTVAEQRSEDSRGALLGRVVREGFEPGVADVDLRVVEEINASLTPGSSTRGIAPLRANEGLCFQGAVPAGKGFKLEPDDLKSLGLTASRLPSVVKPYVIGRDLVQRRQPKFIIDFFGVSEEEAERKWPGLYQHVRDHVYPERKLNKRTSYRDKC